MTRLPALLALLIAAAALFGLDALPTYAAESACPAFYVGGKAPDAPADARGARELCSEAFAVAVSPETRDPVYAAERLTPAGLAAAVQLDRVDAFHADERLPAASRAELSDYRGGEYDRGHMAPSGDMPTASAQHESFALSNMVPQNPNNNRGIWARIEERVRREVVLRREGFVVSGPVFGGLPRRLNGRVAIPARLWKAVYLPGDPSTGTPALAGAYVVDNAPDATPEIVSLTDLAWKIGFDPMPGLPDEVRGLANLPVVKANAK